jgi:hypothetical protein
MDLAVQTGRFVCDQGTVINASVGVVQKLLTIVAEELSTLVIALAVDPDHHLESLLLSQDPRRLLVSRQVDSPHR